MHKAKELKMKHAKVIKEWKAHGLKCFMVVNGLGTINGYVRIPKSHKLYGKDYSEVNWLDCHGGATYSAVGLGSLVKTEDWVFGFDCAHVYDGYNPEFAFEHLAEPGDTMDDVTRMPYGPEDIWRDEAYVQDSTTGLAKQIKEYKDV